MLELSLPALFYRGLTSAARATSLPTIEDETQQLWQSALSDLSLLHSRVSSLSLFSQNEDLADISTRDLVYLLVPFVLAEVEGRVRNSDVEARLQRAERSQRYMQAFVSSLEVYRVIPDPEKVLYAQTTSSDDPARRREIKIKQYQKEKETRSKIQAVRRRRHQSTNSEELTSEFDLIASLLPDPTRKSTTASADEEEDSDTDDILRETTLLILRLLYAQAHSQLQSLSQELQLLRSGPPPMQLPPEDLRRAQNSRNDDTWRLDAPVPLGGPDGKGPLLDGSGKPLRAFTILPSTPDRTRLQAQVFQPDHRLPTLTIDGYLEVERQRGNIISGGG
ncbi:hypothetical protein AcW1_006220 [Taiwanofungus camphoratus]|nr:hypothetical protein AcW2_004978 [Antrodia cinnamomea]KAI0934825.1 hypothetical protein AcV5_006538 [Antrodia cinnamomea]KAI0949890.1 hypothetical protein AcV7_008528 [Antrodia cinnamomea]KAI0958023.1 hypothetical protein AcW1_006220 [Antrodia cinnamomea]